MSARRWKPGDVAIVPFGASDELALRTADGWVCASGNRSVTHNYIVRPLVVIDPEDREQVERLTVLIAKETDGFTARGVDATQAALRSLIAPPKPNEPTGLGAVVEDAEGDRWVKTEREKTEHSDFCWTRGNGYLRWSEVAAVKVLSEGIS